MGTVVAVKNANLDGLVNFAESGAHAGLHRCFGLVTGRRGIGLTCREAALHQGAQRRLVALVVETVALGDLNALLGRLVIGH